MELYLNFDNRERGPKEQLLLFALASLSEAPALEFNLRQRRKSFFSSFYDENYDNFAFPPASKSKPVCDLWQFN